MDEVRDRILNAVKGHEIRRAYFHTDGDDGSRMPAPFEPGRLIFVSLRDVIIEVRCTFAQADYCMNILKMVPLPEQKG